MANDTDGLLTAQNARIQNLEAGLITQGQGLLALEQTQQQILQQLQANNQALNTINTLLSELNAESGKIPSNFFLAFEVPYYGTEPTNANTNTMLLNEAYHYGHAHAHYKPTTNNTYSAKEFLITRLTCNYVADIEFDIIIGITTTSNLSNKIKAATTNVAGLFEVKSSTELYSENGEAGWALEQDIIPSIIQTNTNSFSIYGRVRMQNSSQTNGAITILFKPNFALGIEGITSGGAASDINAKATDIAVYAKALKIFIPISDDNS